MTRIPHDSSLDGERYSLLSDIERPHLQDGLIPLQIRLDELTFSECLQGDREGAPELNIISLYDSVWSGYWDDCGEKIGCAADGQMSGS